MGTNESYVRALLAELLGADAADRDAVYARVTGELAARMAMPAAEDMARCVCHDSDKAE